MSMVPRDPVMLLSFINTQLRDFYPVLEDACRSFDLDEKELIEKLKGIGCEYVPEINQFR